jgi:short-subunit dehydrogenase
MMKVKLLLASIGITGWLWSKQRRQTPQSVDHAVTIITGGASGIGKATAHTFARHGATVIIADLAHQLTDDLKSEFAPYPAAIDYIACDITQATQRASLIDAVLSKHRQIDILINNAGITQGGAFISLQADAIDAMIQVNLLGTIHLTQQVLHVMQTQNQGHIVNVSSINAMMPPPGEAIYSATKAGLNAFSDSLRRELGKTNITVSVVMPALTQTELLNNISEDELRDNQLLMPGMSLDKPQHVASAILKAVQFKERNIICGGQTTETMTYLSQFRPSAMDWVFRHIIDADKFMHTLEKLGQPKNRE